MRSKESCLKLKLQILWWFPSLKRSEASLQEATTFARKARRCLRYFFNAMAGRLKKFVVNRTEADGDCKYVALEIFNGIIL
jgi:hypothetical protein